MSKLFVQVERVKDLMGRADNYFGGGRAMTVEEWKRKNPPIQRKPLTNADHIRAMSDEELMMWLYAYADGSGKTREQWIEWLKKEVDDDT